MSTVSYHINDDGVPGECSAEKRSCPFGTSHYKTAGLAEQAASARALIGHHRSTEGNLKAVLEIEAAPQGAVRGAYPADEKTILEFQARRGLMSQEEQGALTYDLRPKDPPLSVNFMPHVLAARPAEERRQWRNGVEEHAEDWESGAQGEVGYLKRENGKLMKGGRRL